jgi:hypothetical protein
MHQDGASELANEDVEMQGGGGKAVSIYKVMQEPMDLDEIICRSICSFDS